LSPSKFFTKIKSTLNLQLGEKILIGKLSNSATNSNLGYVDVYFEIDEGLVSKVDPKEFVDSSFASRAQVFIRGGYENYEREYGYDKLFIFKSYLNTQSSDKGSCRYTCVFNDGGIKTHLKILKDCPFIAEISQTEFSTDDINNNQLENRIEQFNDDCQDTPLFFQVDSESKKLLGPLVASENDKNIFHGPKNKVTYSFWNSRSLVEYQTFLCTYENHEDHIVSLSINGRARKFLINLDSFNLGANGKPRNQDFTGIDLIPDNCLINEFYKAADKAVGIKPFQKGKVKEWLDNKSIKLDKPRKARLLTILNKYEGGQEDVADIFKNILESEQAVPILKKFATDDEELYLERYRNKENEKIEQFQNSIQLKKSEIEQQNDAVKIELSKNQKELTALNKEKSDLEREINEELKFTLENVEKSEKYQNMLAEKNKELADANKDIEKAINIYGHYSDLEKLSEKEASKSKVIENLEWRIDELKPTIKALQKQAKEESSVLAKAYLNQQIISDIQNHDHYKYLQDQPEQLNCESKSYITIAESDLKFSTDNRNSNRKSVVLTLTDRLRKMNRSIDEDKVEASLIAIMQNQFVVLLGVPGSGKTSFALQFGCALGACKSTLEVPVAKDWTRPKDLMGYYNPISNVYESGVTDFYPFYRSLSKSDEGSSTNSFLVLDEFNLSQPEFYMSNLTGLADNSGNRTINLGHKTNISIPETSRFICTANTDETVQSLSARMISRCAFIQFNELPELDQTVSSLEFPNDLQPLLSGTDMVDLFTATDSDVITASLKSEIDKIISAFREPSDKYGIGISITPRKYNQLLQFCKVMSVQDHGLSKVLDYAFTFFLVPLITGNGQLFKARLENIKVIGEDLSLDDFVKNIDSILNEGEANFEHYRFIMG